VLPLPVAALLDALELELPVPVLAELVAPPDPEPLSPQPPRLAAAAIAMTPAAIKIQSFFISRFLLVRSRPSTTRAHP
jgi:hypothetical protein